MGTPYFPNQRVAQIDYSFHADAEEATLVLGQGDQEKPVEMAQAERHFLEIDEMHAAILTSRPPLITPAETRGHIETILALYQAAGERRPVSQAGRGART